MNPVRKVRRWIMWNPIRFRVAFISSGFVILMLVALYGKSVWDDVMWKRYEIQLAQYEREVAQEAEAAAADALKVADKAARTTPATGATTTPGKPATATPSPTPTSNPEKVSRAFLTAWAAGGKAASDKAWIDSMRPYVTPSMLASFELTDHTSMPKDLKVTGLSTVVSDEQAVTLADVGAFGKIKVTIEHAPDGQWLVGSLVPSDGH